MDDLTRLALVRALVAFSAVLVLGSGVVFAVDRIAQDEPGGTPVTAATPSDEPGDEPAQPLEEESTTWLVWVPGGLPEDFGPSLTSVPVVTDATTTTSDIAWLTRSVAPDGTVVDDPPDPYMIPIDATGVEPTYAGFVPLPGRRMIAALDPGQGLLSESAAKLRSAADGTTLEFGDVSIEVVGTLPDEQMGGHELLVTRTTAEELGVTTERYALFRIRQSSDAAPAELEERFRQLLPFGAEYVTVQVRAPGKVRWLRANDRELPPSVLKSKFGEFAAVPDSVTEGLLEIDPAWIGANIVSAEPPVLGPITCHSRAVFLLKRAVQQLLADAQEDLVRDVGDCWAPIASRTDPDGYFTARPFGASIDLNPATNDPGVPPNQPEDLVTTMERWGFGWGGRDAYPQGSLFSYRKPPKPAD